MATEAHAIYCFETLAARLEKRAALTLHEVESLWIQYSTNELDGDQETSAEARSGIPDEEESEAPGNEIHPHNLRPRQISKLQSESPASSSNASTPSNLSSQNLSSEASKASSSSSLSSSILKSPSQQEAAYPLFVTWNTASSRHHKSLRGCIGTFDDQPLSRGLREYALTSAFNDGRFNPISLSELPALACEVTLLANFTPCQDAMDWEIGTHGIRLSFVYQNRRYGSTYLPSVAPEQGWNKEETIVSLMRKAGWSGRSSEWRKVNDLKCIRYEGQKSATDYTSFKAWRDWVGHEG